MLRPKCAGGGCRPDSVSVLAFDCHPPCAARCLPSRRYTRTRVVRPTRPPAHRGGITPYKLDILNENLWRENRQHLTNITDMPFQGCAGQHNLRMYVRIKYLMLTLCESQELWYVCHRDRGFNKNTDNSTETYFWHAFDQMRQFSFFSLTQDMQWKNFTKQFSPVHF